MLFLHDPGTEPFANFGREENICIAESRNAFRSLHLICNFFHLHFKTPHAYLLCKSCPVCDIAKMFYKHLTPIMSAIVILSPQMS